MPSVAFRAEEQAQFTAPLGTARRHVPYRAFATEGNSRGAHGPNRRPAMRRTDCDGSLRRNNRSEHARADRPGSHTGGFLSLVNARGEKKFFSAIRRADSPRYQPEVTLLRVVTALCSRTSRVKTDTFGSNRYERNSRSAESLQRG
jgi:hypothetical protein